MSIIRAPRPESNFYLLNKTISEDKRISWAARGLLVFLLGKPDHWQVSVNHLRNETKECSRPTGRDGVYSILEELINAGYIERAQMRAEGGKLAQTSYVVSEQPSHSSPLPALPYTDEPDTAGPDTANPTQVSIESKQELKAANIPSADAEGSCKQQAVRVPYESVFTAYADNLPSLPQLKIKDDARRTLIKRLWHSDKRFQTVEFWQKYFAYVSDSHFLMNDCKAIGFDWLLKPANFKKVLEGNYHAAK